MVALPPVETQTRFKMSLTAILLRLLNDLRPTQEFLVVKTIHTQNILPKQRIKQSRKKRDQIGKGA